MSLFRWHFEMSQKLIDLQLVYEGCGVAPSHFGARDKPERQDL